MGCLSGSKLPASPGQRECCHLDEETSNHEPGWTNNLKWTANPTMLKQILVTLTLIALPAGLRGQGIKEVRTQGIYSSARTVKADDGLATPGFHGVLNASQFPGVDMGTKIAAALRAVYAHGGGIVDARGFTCPSQCHIGTANLVVGDGIHPVTLLLPAGKITRGLIPSNRKSVQILYNSKATIIGEGRASTVISGPSSVTAVQQAYNGNANAGYQITDVHLSGFSIQDDGSVAAGSVAFMVGGRNEDGTRGSDVLASSFEDMNVCGADIGRLLDCQHGCDCYLHFYNVNSAGRIAGIKTKNDSWYAYGVNSDQWTIGNIGGSIGLWDSGTDKFTWRNLDFENNRSSTGAVLYARPDGNDAGSGYAVGDTVQPLGGKAGAVLTVLSVRPNGAVTRLVISGAGARYTNAQSVATTTLTGSGSGLRVDIRVSAFMLLLSNGGSFVINPYEEAGGGDYICGTGNFVLGAMFASNGGTYSPTYCTGRTGTYGGPASNFTFGPGATPNSIGLRSRSSYITFGSLLMYDRDLADAYTSKASSINLFADGPAYNGFLSSVYGNYGHSDWNVGTSRPHAGTIDTGRMTVSKLPAPAAPTVKVGAGTGTTPYKYAFACTADGNGGTPLPGPFSTPVNGPSALGAWLVAKVASPGRGGYKIGDTVTVKGGDGTAQLRVTAVDGSGNPTALSVVKPGSHYRTIGRYGFGDSTTFFTTGGTGHGLTVTGTTTYILVTFRVPDGCRKFTLLRDNSKTQLNQRLGIGWRDASRTWFDFGSTSSYAAPARDTTGDLSIAGILQIGGSNGPTWSSGSGAPTGSCRTGSLYTNTREGPSRTLYVCEAGRWSAK